MSHGGNRLVPGEVPKALKGRFKVAQGNALGNPKAPVNLLFLDVLGSMEPTSFSGSQLTQPVGLGYLELGLQP